MPNVKGTPRRGGRLAGTPNKRTQEVIDRLEALGCDPIKGMAIIAREAKESGDLNLAGRMYAELAQYVAPKRKAIEHSGQIAGAPEVRLVLNTAVATQPSVS